MLFRSAPERTSQPSLRGALRGAREIVIAEADDLRAIDTASAVLELVSAESSRQKAGQVPPIRIVVRSMHLARSMREFAMEREGWEAVTVVTLAEAVAEQLAALYPLVDPDAAMPRRAVVLGRRDEVANVVEALLRRSGSAGEARQVSALVLAEGGDADWNSHLSSRLAGPGTELEIQTMGDAGTAVEPFLDQLRRPPAGIAFVIGLSGPDIVGLTLASARRADGWQVVGVLDRNLPSAFGSPGRDRTGSWTVLTIADLLSREDPRSWRTSAGLALAIDRFRQLPSAEAALLSKVLAPDGRSDRLADLVIDSLQEAGYRVLQRGSGTVGSTD